MATDTTITATVAVVETSSNLQAKYYNKKLLSDVTFFVGENAVEIPGHRAIIAAKSDVFEAQFSGVWSDKNEVKLEDVGEIAFKNILWFMYTDEIKVQPIDLLEVLELSHRYNVTGIISALCSEETFSIHGPTQVWKYLTYAIKVSDFG